MSFRPETIRSPSAAQCIAPARAAGLSRIELDPQQDRHARAALEAYADSVAAEMPWLAESLGERLRDTASLTYCGATIARVFEIAQVWAASQPDYAAPAWECVRGHLQRMLGQPLLGQPEQLPATRPRRGRADDCAGPVADSAGAD